MANKKPNPDHRRTSGTEQGETRPPGNPPSTQPHGMDAQEDILLLLEQRSETRRKPGSYLDDWIRRFVRG